LRDTSGFLVKRDTDDTLADQPKEKADKMAEQIKNASDEIAAVQEAAKKFQTELINQYVT